MTRLERPLAILKTGTTEPSLRKRRGDFEDWFRTGLDLEPEDTPVVAVHAGGRLPWHGSLSGCLLTGSSAMITSRADWSERTKAWLRRALEAELPILAVCYGHHLLAEAAGGRADWNPRGREIGTARVHLTPAAAEDPLLAGLESPLIVQESHSQSVLELPPEAVLLASNEADPCQGFRLGRCAWGLQFHPEFDADIVAGYLESRREALESEGVDVEACRATLEDGTAGASILARFADLVAG